MKNDWLFKVSAYIASFLCYLGNPKNWSRSWRRFYVAMLPLSMPVWFATMVGLWIAFAAIMLTTWLVYLACYYTYDRVEEWYCDFELWLKSLWNN